MNALLELVPEIGAPIAWDKVMGGALGTRLIQMRETMQNPVWHGEGDVLAHTKMVCEALIRLPAWRALPARRRQALFIAALLHDLGKTACTRKEDGVWVSPHHAATGAKMARQLLWRECGLCGTAERQAFRETVCALIRWHAVPVRAADLDKPDGKAIDIASEGALVPAFTNELLCVLAEADVRGRIAADAPRCLEQVLFYAALAEEAGCLRGQFPFSSPFSRRAYLSGRAIAPGTALFDDTWGEVILLAGLPGTGKDTYLYTHLPDLPVVSLDGIRLAAGISPAEPQGAVANMAKERAMEFLRRRQPFVWNATNLVPATREKQVSLFSRYGARTRILYLETGWEEQLRRNAARPARVPEDVIVGMLARLVPPATREAQAVDWLCV
jgi:putative nucleotidyltransferase with HDIG domain